LTAAHPRRAGATLIVELVLFALVGGCQWLGHYANFTAVSDGEAPSNCAALGIHDKMAAHGSNLLLIDDPTGGCFWMDAYEVTVKDYQEWLAALGGGTPAWDQTQCGWKTPEAGAPISPFDPSTSTPDECAVPMNELDPFDPQKPIRCVDWCEADAFCRWAGKRLCFITNDFTFNLTPTGQRDEWGLACSAGGTQAYAFNPSTPTACNIAQSSICVNDNAAGCGPYEEMNLGLADCRPADGYPMNLAGNVAEWVDLCNTTSTPPNCRTAGGAYNSSLSEVACTTQLWEPLNHRDETLGLRCCASLTASELQAIGQ
jgi:formylglycine-generating enzyme required for sulfatase activity